MPPTNWLRRNLKGTAGSGTGVHYTVSATPNLAKYHSTKPTTKNYKNETVLLPGLNATNGIRYLLGPTELTGHAVKKAVAQQTQLGKWVVNMSLTSAGTTGWNTMAKKYFHEVIGIELDGVVQSAPLTLPNTATFKTFSGTVQISGSFTQAQAQDLALALNYGSLPIRLTQLTTQTVSPTLGSSSLKAGLAAGIGGLLVVLIYTIIYYRLLGVIVFWGLAGDRGAPVGDHLDPGPYRPRPKLRPRWRDGHHRVHRYHRGLLYRVFRAIKG